MKNINCLTKNSMPNCLEPIAVEDEDFMRPDWLLEDVIDDVDNSPDEQAYPLLDARQYVDLNVNYSCWDSGVTGLVLMTNDFHPVILFWDSKRLDGKTLFKCEFLYVEPPKPPLPRLHQKYPVKPIDKKIHRKNQVQKGQVHGGFNKRF